MIQIPEWRTEPQQVWITCRQFRKLGSFDEYLVQFDANGATYTAFVPARFCDHQNKALRGSIIADYNDDFLVDLPTETLTSGPRILVRGSERESVLQEIE